MGKVNVYLPDDLEADVRAAGLSVSPICQLALRDALDRLRSLQRGDGQGVLTARLDAILAETRARAAEQHRQVNLYDLLGGIIDHGDNLGAQAIASLGVDLPPPGQLRRGRPAGGDGGLDTEVRDVLAASYRIAMDLRHEHVGTEHVVIALAGPGSPLAGLFSALGISDRVLRQQVERLRARAADAAIGGA